MAVYVTVYRSTTYRVDTNDRDEAIDVALGVKGAKAQADAVDNEDTVDVYTDVQEDGPRCPDCGEVLQEGWTPCGPYLKAAERFLREQEQS